MRVEGGVVQVIGIGIAIEIERGIGTGIGNETMIVIGLVIGMVEVDGKEEEGWIGGSEMEEMEVGTGTVIGAGHVLLLGMGTGGHLEVRFLHISEICR